MPSVLHPPSSIPLLCQCDWCLFSVLWGSMAGLSGLASHGGGSPSKSCLQLLILPISHQTESNWQNKRSLA